MNTIDINVKVKKILGDTLTPVSVYMKFRKLYKQSILLESSDYHGNENAYSFICFNPIAEFKVEDGVVTSKYPNNKLSSEKINSKTNVSDEFSKFFSTFKLENNGEVTPPCNGLFGYMNFDSIQYFESMKLSAEKKDNYKIPDVLYMLFKHIIAIDHSKDMIYLIENIAPNDTSELSKIETLLTDLSFESGSFAPDGTETSNLSDDQYREMVSLGKKHCYRGDVFQIVLSRQYQQNFTGDDFQLYRALRTVNPSPYLFYFNFGEFSIFGSSPEAQLRINKGRAIINPIAGTFKRTGNDDKDKELAEQLCKDPKENAEHVMLVDLARNDLSKDATDVKVDKYREVQFFSHVIHLVSEVSGKLPEQYNPISILGNSFPAGTLSGAPKYRAIELIDKYENQSRSYYGGTIGYIGFDNKLNHAIMIRSFLSKNKTLFYQAGAGIVANSVEENELQEVNNKLAALKRAIEIAKDICN